MYKLFNIKKLPRRSTDNWSCLSLSISKQTNVSDPNENLKSSSAAPALPGQKNAEQLQTPKIKSNELPSKYQSPLVPPTKYNPRDVTKTDSLYRTPWHETEGKYYSVLQTFNDEKSHTTLLKALHQPIDLRPSSIKKWWLRRKEETAIALQSYLEERNATLGNELAAAHFIVFRNGGIKFYGQDKWIRKDKSGQYMLPRRYEEDKVVQMIDCSDMTLYYEGLANLANLKQVEWLRLCGVQQVDDWFLDRISNIFKHSLIYLDLRECPNFTERGLGALYKMEKLKILCIDDMLMTSSFEMTCLLLQDANPFLDIRTGSADY